MEHLPQKDPSDMLALYYQQPKPVAANETAASRGRGSPKVLAVD